MKVLSSGPDIVAADSWADDSRRYGLLVTFCNGSRLWTGITTSAATGAEQAPSTSPSPAPPLPALYDSTGRITPERAELYLAAVLTGGHTPEIISAYGYSTGSARNPGVGLHLERGARAFLPFIFTAAPNKSPARRPFTVDATF
ncbi:hypothetical protein [Streptomyces sp. S1D4-20]|uniref:hypothetical protein n=1 Tax=Streptomyces sp. S1D4-20 TaxID=2594462 RepID=UPI001165A168|nr:hypothetical protein [Streptomyces sp. S1D4-20]QDN54204.1 hypothetical protein FNV67_01140 [Streptomyces sp. S1D4-20]